MTFSLLRRSSLGLVTELVDTEYTTDILNFKDLLIFCDIETREIFILF